MSENDISSVILGHDEAIRQVSEAFASKRMHHAWLITGVEGIGKATLARHIAHHVLSNGANPIGKLDMGHPVAKLVNAGTHPDQLTVTRAVDEKTGEPRSVIIVEDALKVATFLRKTSTHGGWRVVVLDEAHRLNRFGQNAILKILEEPPLRTIILLTVTTAGALLPTIRSRCRVLSLAPLPDPVMTQILMRQAPQLDVGDVQRLVKLAGGSAGFALKLVESGALPLYDELIALLQMPSPLDIQRLQKLADQVSRKADAQGFEALTVLLHDYLRGFVREAAAMKDASQVQKGLAAWDRAQHLLGMVESSSLDRKLALINAVTALRVA